jgi:hypothetical protein
MTISIPLIGLNHMAHIANMSNGNVKDDGPFETGGPWGMMNLHEHQKIRAKTQFSNLWGPDS